MEINDMVMVSVDDHVIEPPDLFEGHLPAKYADLAPKFITNEDGTNAWLYEGNVLPNVALNAVAGRPKYHPLRNDSRVGSHLEIVGDQFRNVNQRR